jgi:hypothetical protein
MKPYYGLVCLVCLLSQNVSAQRDYKGLILDNKTKEPLSYVNIGIVDKGIGTVSDEDGIFHLNLDRESLLEDDIILFSSLGYQTKQIRFSDAVYAYNEYPEIFLTPSEIELNEVVVTDTQLVPITEYLGYQNNGNSSFGYWRDNIALGGELATKIRAPKGQRQLNSLEFEVWENPSDSLLVRINIYDKDGVLGQPNTNLNKSNKKIITTLKMGRGFVDIDLEPYDIYVEDDFFVSLELLKVYGDAELGLVLAASDGDHGSYRKYASQGKWEKLSDINMAYYLKTSPYVSQNQASKHEAKVQKIRQKQRMLSGFAIHNGVMLADVTVKNNRTRETAKTDANGRYAIPVEKNDILLFTKKGYVQMFLEVKDQQFANAPMKREGSTP